jgi:arylsulfatase A-like enzyme
MGFMKKLILLTLLVIAVLLAIHFWFSSRTLNVILITADTFRRDHSTCYNPAAPSTPNIDAIAQNGVLFKNGFTLVPTTLPAHATMLASLPPHELNIFNNGDIYHDKIPLLQEILQQHGYETAGFVSMGVLKQFFGVGRGFKTYEDDFNDVGRFYRYASEMNEMVLPWIRDNAKKPFFLFVHYSDPHEPYLPLDAPPDMELFINGESKGLFCLSKKEAIAVPFRAKPGENIVEFVTLDGSGKDGRLTEAVHVTARPRADLELAYGEEWQQSKRQKGGSKYFLYRGKIHLTNKASDPVDAEFRFAGKGKVFQSLKLIKKNYAEEVQYMDRHIGQLWQELERLNLKQKTLVIFTADHGESFAEHGRVGHGFPLYKENLEVPFIVSYPGLGRKGVTSNRVVNHMDIMPTVLDLLGIDHTGTMKGHSLKADLSWSPIHRLDGIKRKRSQTFFYTYAPAGRANSYALLHDKLKLIQTWSDEKWKWEAYDLARDPAEKQNLIEMRSSQTETEKFSTLRKLLNEQKEEGERAFGNHENPQLNEEQKEMLRDLGYIAQ